MVNDVGFVISEEDGLPSGLGTKLQMLINSCGRNFISVKKGQRKLLT